MLACCTNEPSHWQPMPISLLSLFFFRKIFSAYFVYIGFSCILCCLRWPTWNSFSLFRQPVTSELLRCAQFKAVKIIFLAVTWNIFLLSLYKFLELWLRDLGDFGVPAIAAETCRWPLRGLRWLAECCAAGCVDAWMRLWRTTCAERWPPLFADVLLYDGDRCRCMLHRRRRPALKSRVTYKVN